MTVELRPLGVSCNIACQYCYQNPQRDAGNLASSFDVDAMKQAIEREGGPFTLFGGEPLLVPEDVLEQLWRWGYERWGQNGMQTNGALINDNHIRMFREYRVHVGISIDGPGELNDVRWAGSLAKTREATMRTEAAIERLCGLGLAPSLIITLHRNNATGEKLPRLSEWLRDLDRLGVRSARLHVLEVESQAIRDKYGLTVEENVAALLHFAKLEPQLEQLRFDLFKDLRRMLLGGDDNTTCVWNACDPYTTRAVRGVEGHGQRSNCGRTNKDGIDFIKSDREGFERYLALYHTPHQFGGCSGCRFFLMCRGQCPGTADAGDWRNRSEHCGVWMTLYEHVEAQLLTAGQHPISSHPIREPLEAAILAGWARGENLGMSAVLRRLEHALTGKAQAGDRASAAAHGDEHGDHYDGAGRTERGN